MEGATGSEERATFTGLSFARESGLISLSPSRLWKVRLALLAVASAPSISGTEMLQIIGHFNWAVLLRRPLLSILSCSYKFAERAGERRWRIWSSVRAELRQAAALVVFARYDSRRAVCSEVTHAML